ncbi:MAG: OsmC family protein [Planctomycetota bacterium]|nr:OsmC family protein [Planctomycetota bacterium]
MNLPHDYQATATAQTTGNVVLAVPHAAEIASHAPSEFGGPGDQWSPEDLVVAAVADCFILSFRAIASMSKYDWRDLRCEVVGALDKVDRDIQFVRFQLKVTLVVPPESDIERAERLLAKAEATCFITNSLKAETHLETEIRTG